MKKRAVTLFLAIVLCLSVLSLPIVATGSTSGQSTLLAPTASLASGAYFDEQLSVTLSADAEIYYTLDGSTPTKTSNLYGEAIVISKSVGKPITLKAVACSGDVYSEVMTASYRFSEPRASENGQVVYFDGTEVPATVEGYGQKLVGEDPLKVEASRLGMGSVLSLRFKAVGTVLGDVTVGGTAQNVISNSWNTVTLNTSACLSGETLTVSFPRFTGIGFFIVDYIGTFADENAAANEAAAQERHWSFVEKRESIFDNHSVMVHGVQKHEVNAGTLRFVGLLDDYKNPIYQEIGFKVQANGIGNKKPIKITVVYESLAQKGGNPIRPERDGETFFTYCISGINRDVVGASDVTFLVSAYAIIDGVEAEGSQYEIVYDIDNDQITVGGNYEASALQNTYHCLESDGKLNVAYIGGSVTVGAFADAGKCYRELTTKWFKDNFDAKIIETAAGIGGTGSFWGAYRAIEHLKLDSETERPDLVFIDFAVNDYYDGTSVEDIQNYADAMIREIYRANPYAEIVILIVGEQWTVNAASSEAWRAVAKHYNLPCIELVQRLLTDIQANNKTWEDYVADSVHPNTEGHAMYASYVAEFLQAELIDKEVNPHASIKKALPATGLGQKQLSDLGYYEVYRCFIPTSSSFSPYNVTDETGRGIATTKAGSMLSFSFSGTGIVLSLGTRDDIVLEYTIDGVKYADVNLSGTDRVTLAEGLENKTHTVSICVKSITSGVFHIRRILVQGNTAREGIAILPYLVQNSNGILVEDGKAFADMFQGYN